MRYIRCSIVMFKPRMLKYLSKCVMFDMDDVSAFTIDAFMTAEKSIFAIWNDKYISYVGFGSRKINKFLRINMELMYTLCRCCWEVVIYASSPVGNCDPPNPHHAAKIRGVSFWNASNHLIGGKDSCGNVLSGSSWGYIFNRQSI